MTKTLNNIDELIDCYIEVLEDKYYQYRDELEAAPLGHDIIDTLKYGIDRIEIQLTILKQIKEALAHFKKGESIEAPKYSWDIDI